MIISPIGSNDESTLWQFLAIAVHEPVENGVGFVRQHPIVSRYVRDFGREHDFGFFAFQDAGSTEPIGAIWARAFSSNERGYGFIDEKIPELALAVVPEFQNRGVGKSLLSHFIEATRTHYEAVSLNVRDENLAAIALYGGAGFKRVKGSEIKNRAGGVSFNMILKFAK